MDGSVLDGFAIASGVHMPDQPEQVSPSALEEVSHAAFSGVLRAVESRNMSIESFPGPILIGLVAWPQLSSGVGSTVLGQHAPPPDSGVASPQP